MATSRRSKNSVAADTIAAIATPLGEAGLGVIRLSGPAAVSIASSLFDSQKTRLAKASSHTLHTGWIKQGQHRLDQAVAALFRGPHSYTGEDVVELSCHGSPSLLKELLALCVKEGARLAKPGEFTERAYLNGKMDLVQAEAVAELIHSGSSAARAAAADQLHGNLSARIKKIREALVRFLAHLEANLDFVEEDIPALNRKTMAAELEKIHAQIEELLSTSLRGRITREGLRVALVGRPNVGKSSLFNALLAAERAIVTDAPGTTRDVLEEKIEWDGVAVVLSDTAGLRESKDAAEIEGARRSRHVGERADVVLFIVDAGSPLSAEDKKIAAALKEKSTVAVMNKIDRGRKMKTADLPFSLVVQTSATKRTGLADLKKAILQAAFSHLNPLPGRRGPSEGIITNLRHVTHLEKAARLLEDAGRGVRAGKSEEALAISAREALQQISLITGESASEEVLDSIFRQFCIGK